VRGGDTTNPYKRVSLSRGFKAQNSLNKGKMGRRHDTTFVGPCRVVGFFRKSPATSGKVVRESGRADDARTAVRVEHGRKHDAGVRISPEEVTRVTKFGAVDTLAEDPANETRQREVLSDENRYCNYPLQ
jgi:hypothetical protein